MWIASASLTFTTLLPLSSFVEDVPSSVKKVEVCRNTDGRLSGTIAFFNPQKGYSFINPDIQGQSIFVHITDVERSGLKELKEGDRLMFRIGNGKSSTAATDLVRCK